MLVYHDFFLLPGSRLTFPEVDPDPAQWYGSNRIRIRNTTKNNDGWNDANQCNAKMQYIMQ